MIYLGVSFVTGKITFVEEEEESVVETQILGKLI